MERYGLKMFYRMTAGSRVFYEESVVMLWAESFDDAYKKAEIYAKDMCGCDYINICGETVKTELVDIVDCFIVYEEENGVTEVYSRYMQNKTPLSEEKFIDLLSDSSTVEERYPLRSR